MNQDSMTREQLDQLINSHKVVLFLKGTREKPQCGSSSGIVRILDLLLEDYATVDVARQPEITDALALYTNWPAVPQLFVNGEFVGGADVVREMHTAGEFRGVLGLPPLPEVGIPNVTITDAAAKVILDVMGSMPHVELYLEVDALFRHSLSIVDRDERVTRRSVVNGIPLCFDAESAVRADGLVVETDASGKSLRIENPNKPQTAGAPSGA